MDGALDVTLLNRFGVRFWAGFTGANGLEPAFGFWENPVKILFGCAVLSAGFPNGVPLVNLKELPSAESNGFDCCARAVDDEAFETLLPNRFDCGAG